MSSYNYYSTVKPSARPKAIRNHSQPQERDPFVEGAHLSVVSQPMGAMTPSCTNHMAGWRRDPGDERVAALREQLMHSNCMDDLVTFSAMDPEAWMTWEWQSQRMCVSAHGQFDSMT